MVKIEQLFRDKYRSRAVIVATPVQPLTTWDKWPERNSVDFNLYFAADLAYMWTTPE